MRSTFAFLLMLALASRPAGAQSASPAAASAASDTVAITRFGLVAMDADSLPSDYRQRAYVVLRLFLPAVPVDGAWQRELYFTVHADRSVSFQPGAVSDTLERLLETGISNLAQGGAFTPLPAPSTDSIALGLTVSRQPTAKPVLDSAFVQTAVDKPVRRRSSFTRPKYPAQLLEMHIEGYALVQFVVDTTGLVDPASFHVLRATDPLFADAVRDVLPFLRYEPAERAGKKVRQAVRQTFNFLPEPTRRLPAPPFGSALPNGPED